MEKLTTGNPESLMLHEVTVHVPSDNQTWKVNWSPQSLPFINESIVIVTLINQIENGGFDDGFLLGDVPNIDLALSGHNRHEMILSSEQGSRTLQFDTGSQSGTVSDRKTVKRGVGARHRAELGGGHTSYHRTG